MSRKRISDMQTELVAQLEKATSIPGVMKALHKLFVFLERICKTDTGLSRYYGFILIDMGDSLDRVQVMDDSFVGKTKEDLEELSKFIEFTKVLIKQVAKSQQVSRCHLLDKIKFMFEFPIKRALENLESGGVNEADILAIIENCPYSDCPVCLSVDFSRDISFVKLKECRHLICLTCMNDYKKTKKSYTEINM